MDQAGWTGPEYPNTTNPDGGINATVNYGTGCLFNITKDPEERVNIAETETAILKEMQQRLAKYQATYFNPNRGTAWPGACDKAMKDFGGFWGPFVP